VPSIGRHLEVVHEAGQEADIDVANLPTVERVFVEGTGGLVKGGGDEDAGSGHDKTGQARDAGLIRSGRLAARRRAPIDVYPVETGAWQQPPV
jgi:hypothetical protein